MRIIYILSLLLVSTLFLSAQTFTRSELPSILDTPWEIIYGPDGMLWVSESKGTISKVDPISGAKNKVFQAPDYFGGSPSETSPNCFGPKIGSGTLGMALQPDFLNPNHAYIYFAYSYDSGTPFAPLTKFGIKRLTWSASADKVIADTNIVDLMPNGYDHLGGRLMIISQNNIPYLFFTVGDNGVSETNSPGCYFPESSNPNNFAQDPNYKNGKVHRFNLDGSIPSSNPIPGNSFYTRGHRNPQGLAYNPDKKIIYEIEHGDRTDDEINILQAGMNYGWKFVRGFHSDGNFPGELQFVNTYTPYPGIANDALKEPLYSWCATTQPTISNNADWCTVAPSDGIYYGSSAIADWKNSILVVTLKKGSNTRQELYQFKLNEDGLSLAPSTSVSPNPKRFFGDDQNLNGRLRDIAISPDGNTIYLVNNGGADRDKISVYKYNAPPITATLIPQFDLQLFPVPTDDLITIKCNGIIESLNVYNIMGQEVEAFPTQTSINLAGLSAGTYFVRIKTNSGAEFRRKVLKL